MLASVGGIVWAWRIGAESLRQIIKESTPVLAGALILSSLAGLVLQKQSELLEGVRAVFVLQPAFVSSAGALGESCAGGSPPTSTSVSLSRRCRPTRRPGVTCR